MNSMEQHFQNVIDKNEGCHMYSDEAKLRLLYRKIKADFLVSSLLCASFEAFASIEAGFRPPPKSLITLISEETVNTIVFSRVSNLLGHGGRL